ncbi:MAG: RAD52 family DNA repair protein [Cyanobacteriota bacterium]|nr:RAD52 family DNA repair protein [Cyanobacteriota bacterium]
MTTTTFSPEQLSALAAPLERSKVKQREQGRSKVSYLEGWQVIAEANRIFGFDGWQRETVEVRCVAERERSIGSNGRSGWGVTYTARVRVRVGTLIREGTGGGHGIDGDLGQAHESAIKEAETDAMKRALMTFGNPFGLALYDKQQREVSSDGGTPAGLVSPLAKAITSAPAPSKSPEQDPALAPLDPATTRQLLATLRSLPRPALEGFTQAFRKRFQVPDEAASIAGRICQKRHHDWIEAYLTKVQPARA